MPKRKKEFKRWTQVEENAYTLNTHFMNDYLYIRVYLTCTGWRGVLLRLGDNVAWRFNGFKNKTAAKAAMLEHYYNAWQWEWPHDCYLIEQSRS